MQYPGSGKTASCKFKSKRKLNVNISKQKICYLHIFKLPAVIYNWYLSRFLHVSALRIPAV